MFMLVMYDVEAGRTSKLRRLLLAYLGHEQNSVFFGEITQSSAMELRHKIKDVLNEKDNIIEICVENRHNVDIKSWSKSSKNAQKVLVENKKHKENAIFL